MRKYTIGRPRRKVQGFRTPPPPPPPAPNSSEADLASEESLTTFIDNWEVKNESRIAPTMHFNHGRFYIIKNQLV